MLIKIFSQVIDEVLFGRDNGIKVHGMSIPEATDEMFHLAYNVAAQDPLNAFLGGYPAHLNLIKSMQTATKINKDIETEIEIEYNQRMKKPLESLGINILDSMVRHNRTCKEEEKLSVKDIAANCVLFQIAGVDTSKSVVEFVLCDFAAQAKNQAYFYESISSKSPSSELDNYSSFAENDLMQHFVKEALRLYSPTGLLFPRLVLKDTKIGKYLLRKGARYMVSFTQLHFDEKFYANAKVLNPERFLRLEKEKNPRISPACNMPFGMGKRSCLGRYLGELFIEIALVHLTRSFEFKALKGDEK